LCLARFLCILVVQHGSSILDPFRDAVCRAGFAYVGSKHFACQQRPLCPPGAALKAPAAANEERGTRRKRVIPDTPTAAEAAAWAAAQNAARVSLAARIAAQQGRPLEGSARREAVEILRSAWILAATAGNGGASMAAWFSAERQFLLKPSGGDEAATAPVAS
jgi:hypothetical protein